MVAHNRVTEIRACLLAVYYECATKNFLFYAWKLYLNSF